MSKLISVKQASEILCISDATCRRLIKIGDIKGYKVGSVWKVDINSCYALIGMTADDIENINNGGHSNE